MSTVRKRIVRIAFMMVIALALVLSFTPKAEAATTYWYDIMGAKSISYKNGKITFKGKKGKFTRAKYGVFKYKKVNKSKLTFKIGSKVSVYDDEDDICYRGKIKRSTCIKRLKRALKKQFPIYNVIVKKGKLIGIIGGA